MVNTPTKTCPKCHIKKFFYEFARNSRRSDGRASECKTCGNLASRERYKLNAAKYLKRQKEYFKLHPDKYKEKWQKGDAVTRFKYPEKWKARQLLRVSVRRGLIQKLPCQICGDVKSQGHHPNYSRPKEVIWLCKTHHVAMHRTFPSLNN